MTELEVHHLRGGEKNNIGWGALRWQEMVGIKEVLFGKLHELRYLPTSFVLATSPIPPAQASSASPTAAGSAHIYCTTPRRPLCSACSSQLRWKIRSPMCRTRRIGPTAPACCALPPLVPVAPVPSRSFAQVPGRRAAPGPAGQHWFQPAAQHMFMIIQVMTDKMTKSRSFP